jgi:hypothetical protein
MAVVQQYRSGNVRMAPDGEGNKGLYLYTLYSEYILPFTTFPCICDTVSNYKSH